jgi:hypothetical protein
MQRSQKFTLAILAGSLLVFAVGAHKVAQAIQPFFTSNNFTVLQGQDTNIAQVVVPSGFTWVVESMSGRIILPTGQHIESAVLFTTTPNPSVLWANPSLISQGGNGRDVYLFNDLTRGYPTAHAGD